MEPDLEPATQSQIRRYLAILEANDLDPVTYKELVEMGKNDTYLYTCTCRSYLHYGWCLHTCLMAFAQGIIRRFPKTLDPTPIGAHVKKKLKRSRGGGGGTAGRPKKAKGGESRLTY